MTIPQDVRRHLGIEPRSGVEFEVDDQGARLVRRGEGGAALVATMRGRGGVPMSTDEMMALTRDDS
ncbi:MAG: AbrB/MazE/SpoVT family DNA-binding domain-containing protein [Solirubrobacteraceae bacterium]